MNTVPVIDGLVVALSAPGSLAAALLAVVPVGLGLWLFRKSSRSDSTSSASTLAATDLVGLRAELAENYDRLRCSREAVPLAADAWRRIKARAETYPVVVHREVRLAYHAIEVSNRLLDAAVAYDSRGHLSLRQRRIALWPTLETAVREALAALGEAVTPAVQGQNAAVAPVEAARWPTAKLASAGPRLHVEHPQLTVSRGPEPVAAFRLAPVADEPKTIVSLAAVRRKQNPFRQRRKVAGQMPLWESVA
jgi:hypothetical protein